MSNQTADPPSPVGPPISAVVPSADLLSALSAAGEATLTMDQNHSILFFDDGAERLLGYGREEVIGRRFDILVPPRLQARHRAAMRRFERSRERARRLGDGGEIILVRKDGEELAAEGSISRSHRGTRWTCTVVLRDATEQKRHREALQLLVDLGPALSASRECQAASRAFAGLVAGRFADLCVVMIKPDERCAAHVEIAHHDPAKEALARAYFTSDDPSRLRLLTEAMHAGQPSLLSEIPAELRWEEDAYSGIAAPLLAPGESLGAVLFMSSAPRRYGRADTEIGSELARRAALAIDNACYYALAARPLQAHDEMLSFIAHDLRNPLNVIMMAVQLLLGAKPIPDEYTRRWLRTIGTSGEQMNAFIEDLLAAARTRAGRLVLHRRPTRSDLLLRQAAELHEHMAERKGLQLEVRAPDPAPAVEVDVDAVVRALSNLIGNAVKFTPDGGSITVGTEQLEDELHFYVSDTGPGIREDHLPRLFDRFWQAPGSQGGTGLGLAIVKGTVEAHGGRVWVESRLGAGSTFHFTIPVASEAPGAG